MNNQIHNKYLWITEIIVACRTRTHITSTLWLQQGNSAVTAKPTVQSHRNRFSTYVVWLEQLSVLAKTSWVLKIQCQYIFNISICVENSSSLYDLVTILNSALDAVLLYWNMNWYIVESFPFNVSSMTQKCALLLAKMATI